MNNGTLPSSQGPAKNAPGFTHLTRRSFLGRTVLAAGALTLPQIVPGSALGANGSVPPSRRVNVALIGRGAMGSGHLHRLAGDQAFQLMAVCDADKARRDLGVERVESTYAAARDAGTYKGCFSTSDYREILARADIDAVLIASPDHWHTLQSIDAAKAGKDIYCEKPVSVTIEEGRRLVSAVRRYGRVFQTGTQYRSAGAIRTVCNFIREGRLGKIRSVFTLLHGLDQFMGWRFKGDQADKWRAAGKSFVPLEFALEAEPVPEGLDWDMWVGPAPWREYNHLYHANPVSGVVPWSFDSAFGVAASTWFMSHATDVIQYALGVERSGPVEIVHPSTGEFPTITCRYANGTLMHFVENWAQVNKLYNELPGARLAGNFGGVFLGERGWLSTLSTGGQLEGSPESLFDEMRLVRTPEVNIGGNNHHANWLECMHTRKAPSADEEIGHRAAAVWHLLSACFQTGHSLKWDPVKEIFPGDSAANRLLSRAMRAPWRM